MLKSVAVVAVAVVTALAATQGLAALTAGGRSGDVATQLKQLFELKQAGALTDAEYEREKQKLLGN